MDHTTDYLTEQFIALRRGQAQHQSLDDAHQRFNLHLARTLPDDLDVGFVTTEHGGIEMQFLGFRIHAAPRLVRSPRSSTELVLNWTFYDELVGAQVWSFFLTAAGAVLDGTFGQLDQANAHLFAADDPGAARMMVAHAYAGFLNSDCLRLPRAVQ